EIDEGSQKNVGEMANVSKIQRFHGLGFALMVCLRNMESAQVKTSTSFNSSFGMVRDKWLEQLLQNNPLYIQSFTETDDSLKLD
ncbi:hypothetical protein RYX36_017979, partial [Vicia faba]